MLTDAPAGISWTVIPRLTASTGEQLAQLADVCRKATSIVDSYCRQPLRATVNTETGTGPGVARTSVSRDTGIGKLITRRWPVTEVAAVQVSPARSFPPQWSLIPAEQVMIGHPVIMSAVLAAGAPPSGGNVIEVAPRWVNWDLGRGGWRVLTSYLGGFGPHAGLTEDASEGDEEIHVDDVTGWAGAAGIAYDGMQTEAVTASAAAADSPAQLPGVAGTVQAGPGTLTLSQPLASGHAKGTVLSGLPEDVIHAAALAAMVQALEGIDAIATQSLSGQMAGGTGTLATEMEMLLDPYRAVA
jgi:hypothetical protein